MNQERKLPEQCYLISDFDEKDKLWMSGIYISDFCPLVRAFNKNRTTAESSALKLFHEFNDEGKFNGILNQTKI